MTLTSVAAVRAAPTIHAEWASTIFAANGAYLVYATSNPITAAPDVAGVSPTTLAGVDALPADGLITRLLSDLPGVAAWHALFDLLWVSPDLPVATVGTTTFTPGPLPPRDVDRTSNGRGVVLGYTSSVAAGPTVSYTNSAGVTGRTATIGTNNTASTVVLLPLQAGDEGVRSVQSFTVPTAGSGTVRLLLLRPVGRYLAGPLDPGQKLPMALSPLIAGTVLLNAQQPFAGGLPAPYVRAEIAVG